MTSEQYERLFKVALHESNGFSRVYDRGLAARGFVEIEKIGRTIGTIRTRITLAGLKHLQARLRDVLA